MDKNLKIARDILIAHDIDPDENWQLADAIRCALVDAEFEATFGSDNPTIKLVQ